MPATIFGNPAAAVGLYQAFYGKAPANATYVNNVALAAQNGTSALAAAIGANFATTPAADLAKTVLANLGISNATLETALGQIFTAYPASAHGQIVLNLTNLLSGLEGDATYGAAAKAYNLSVAANNAYSSNPSNTTDSTPGSTTGNEAGKSLVLTTAQDVLTGTSGADNFRGVAGNPIGAQDQTTLNSSDIIDGGAGADAIIVNLLGNYGGGARIKGIETLKLGTNIGASTFDYNVNAGFNEISDVTTIVADQINAGEMLTVQNIVRTDAAGAKVLPTLSWENDSNTGVAGTVNYDYRAAELTGTADTQVVGLDSVNNGVLNLAAGIETVTLKSVAGERVTLLNSDRRDNATAGVNDVRADIISNGSLTTVNIEAAGEVGKVGGRVVTTGLVDRVATDGLGDASTGTAANLLSVGARVTTVNAKDSTAAVNVQFLAKVTGAATDVTFTGGKGGDYAEFEVGNVNADGGEGNDVFAFVTQRAGVTNSTFGSGDSIKGGAGTDTIQIGVNGVGNYDVASSEFLNKSGIDVLDLRGAVNTVSVSAAFAGQTDGAALQITTDNVVVGGIAPSDAEAATVNTINLRELTPGQAIKFTGGQGSDRLILKDGVYTQAMDLDGGLQTNAAGVAAAGDYDTLTVVNSAVLDRTDLSNTRNFEGLNLVKDVAGASQFTVELTEAFLLANTAATNSLTTSIDDRAFQIGSSASALAGSVALVAGDLVKIDVTDLFNTATNTLKASVVGRQIDVGTLAAGVQYVYNGVTYNSVAALQAVVGAAGVAVLQGADAAGRTGVIGAAAPGAVVATPVALTAGGAFAGTAGVNDNFTGTYASLNGTTITGTLADTETLTLTTAATQIGAGVGGTITNIDVLQLADVANTVTFGVNSTGITTVIGGSANDNITVTDAVLQPAGSGGPAGVVLSLNGNNGNDTLTVTAASTLDLTNDSVTNFETLTTGAAVTVGSGAALNQFSTITLGGPLTIASGAHNVTAATVTPAANNITINAGASLTIGGDANVAATANFIGATGTLITTGALTLAGATDTIGNVTFGQAGVTITDDSALATGRVFTGSAGADTLALDAAGAAANSVGRFAGFQVGASGDVIDLSGTGAGNAVALTTFSAGGSIAGSIAAAAPNIVSLVALSGAAAQVNGAFSNVTAINAITNAGLTGNSAGFLYVALDNGTDTAIYRVQLAADAGAAGVNVAADIPAVQQIVTLTGIADVGTLVAANIA